jgi:cytoskeleton protein RodZ
VGERKDQEPQFGRLDDLGENTTSPVGLRSDAPGEPGMAAEREPGVSSASGLTTRDQPVETQPTLPDTPGDALRLARERKGLDTATLAQRTRLSRKTVEDLEFNRFGEIPPTYVRGYLRAVARELDADGDAWVRGYENLGYAEPTVGPTTKGSAAGKARRTRSGRGYLLILLVVLGVLALGVYAWQRDNGGDLLERIPGASWLGASPSEGPLEETPVDTPVSPVGEPAADAEPLVEMTFDPAPTPVPAPASAPAPAPAPAPGLGLDPEPIPGLPADSVPELTRPAAAAPIESADSETAVPGAREQEGLAEPADPAAPVASVESAATEPAAVASTAGRSLLELSFQETSWAEIRSASDTIELRGVFDRGDRRSIEVELPARVVLGNAPGVTLDLDGEAVDLAPHTRADRTARFDLGADR